MDVYTGPLDWETAQDTLSEAGVTDGLPVVPPTPERVARMLAAAGREPYEKVCQSPLLFGEVTWQDAAINAVMAGCRPEYLRVIAAAIDALTDPEFNLLGVATTTGSAAIVVIVNGPLAARIGINAADNALGPGHRANATIGRAVNLILRNIGGAMPGEVDMATLGQSAKFSCCYAENEAASPWPSLHVERGFKPEDSVVTVFAMSGILEMVDTVNHTGEGLAITYAQSMLHAGGCGSSGYAGGGQPLLILPPEIATIFQDDGYDKPAIKRELFERALMPLDRLSPVMADRIRNARRMSLPEGTTAEVATSIIDADMRIAETSDDVLIVVAGGVGIKAALMPSWSATRAISRRIA